MIRAFATRNYKCLHTDKIKLAPLTFLSGGNNVGKTTYLKALLDFGKNQEGHKISNLPLLSNYKAKVFRHQNKNDISFEIETLSHSEQINMKTVFSYHESFKAAFQSYIRIDEIVDNEVVAFLEMQKEAPEKPYRVKANNIFSIMFATVKSDVELPQEFEAVGDFDFLGYVPYVGKFAIEENPHLSEWFVFDEDNKAIQLKLDRAFPLLHEMSSIHYIGPVRSNPEEFYFLETRNLDMDSSGKNTIEIVERLQNKKIKFYEQLSDTRTVEKTLLKAVKFWFSYFFGNTTFDLKQHTETLIQVLINGHPINHSGFGFSQLLPIVVKALLLKEGETLILEQPELHLHPALERKLAYFLLCITKNNRQIIAETHSEHMINELVIQRVKDQELAKKFQVYFLTQNIEHTYFEPIKINDRGEIENWPDGFFDQYLLFSKELIEERRKIALEKIAKKNEEK